jgi:hypothetical protein
MKIDITKEMTKARLDEKHPLYTMNAEDWQQFRIVYDSGKQLIEEALFRYNFEKAGTHEDRKKDGYVFNPGKAIVNVFNYYLTEQLANRELGGLSEDEIWKMFTKDCDLKGTDYDDFINESQKQSSVGGAVGILVNKPGNPGGTEATAIKNGIYPYLALYTLENIYDWEFERNKITHRPELIYLKLREEDGTYHFWFQNSWEIWRFETQGESKDTKPQLIDKGENPLGEIPFTWLINVRRGVYHFLGISDLVEIAPIVCSIARDLSEGQEVIKMAGHPMLRLPMEENTDDASVTEAELDAEIDAEIEGGTSGGGGQPSSPRTVHYFNAEHGASGKPDWMPTEILEPITAILNWIDRKIDHCYEVALLSGIHGQRSGEAAESGLKLRYEFKQLFSVLSKKSNNMTEAELTVIRLWLLWRGKSELFKEVKVERPKEFSLDDLSVALNNIFTSARNVISKTFRVKAMNKAAYITLPDMDDKTKKEIEAENEANTPDLPPLFDQDKDDSRNQSGSPPGGARPADEANLNQE